MRSEIVACDVGSTKQGNFGWAHVRADDDNIGAVGTTVAGCVSYVAELLEHGGTRVALGLESPLWIPVPLNEKELSSGRPKEGNRSMFAPTGGYVTTLGIHQFAFILRQLSKSLKQPLRCVVTKDAWVPGTLLLWEAFVSGEAHSKQGVGAHVRDAATAAQHFSRYWPDDRTPGVGKPEAADEFFSLVGGLLAWGSHQGWIETAADEMWHAPLVIRPTTAYEGSLPAPQD